MVSIHIIVGEHRNIFITGIVQRFSEQRTIMCKTTVPYIFSHTHCYLLSIIFSASQRCQCFADDNLCRETDIIMNILFSQTDGIFSSHFQWYCTDTLSGKSSRHNTAKCMRGIRYQYDSFFSALFCKFHWVRIRKSMYFPMHMKFPAHLYCLYKGSHTNLQRSLHITFIQLQNQRRLS